MPAFLQRVMRKAQRLAAAHLARRPGMLRNERPIVSFTFDDFPVSALSIAGPMLQQHHIAGTYYLSLGLTGTVAPTGPIVQKADLPQVLEQGHELGCHTYAHCHSTDTRSDEFERNILANRDALSLLLPKVQMKSLSYPIGCPRPDTKRRCAKYFQGCRAGGQIYNAGEVDLDNLQAFFLEQSRDDLNAVRAMIDATCRANGWLILATHDVCPNPTRYGVEPEFFEAVVRHAVASGAELLSVSEGLGCVGRRKAED